MASNVINQVWNDNFHSEMTAIEEAMRSSEYVAVDTECSGYIRNTPREAPGNQVYADLKYNIDRLNPVQLGLTFLDATGSIIGVWQVYFSDFDPEITDEERKASSICLGKRKSGIDFTKQREEGVLSRVFGLGFAGILRRCQEKVKWVFFHGHYDLGYLTKLLTNSPLPDTRQNFQITAGGIFKTVFDVKFIAKFCPGLLNGEIGLGKLSKILDVRRVGQCHQAGSDSLITAQVFQKMKEKYSFDEDFLEGYIYQIDGKIQRMMPQPILVIPRPFCAPVPTVYHCVPNMVYHPRPPVFVLPRYTCMLIQ